VDGYNYIDCYSGRGGKALGHVHPAVVEAAKKQIESSIPRFSPVDPFTGKIHSLFLYNWGFSLIGRVDLLHKIDIQYPVKFFTYLFHNPDVMKAK
jgi:hypothetical protein